MTKKIPKLDFPRDNYISLLVLKEISQDLFFLFWEEKMAKILYISQ